MMNKISNIYNKNDLPDFDKKFISRFLSLCSEPDVNGCINWLGYTNHDGYGRIQYEKKKYLCHRISYKINCGLIPLELQVNHNCPIINPACVNHKHLYLGTPKQNSIDAVNDASIGNNLHIVEEVYKDIGIGLTQAEISRKYNLDIVVVHRIVNKLCYHAKDITLPMWVSKNSKTSYKYDMQINGKRYMKYNFSSPEDAYQAALEIRNSIISDV